MGQRTIYERFMWFDDQSKRGRFPNTSTLAKRFEISTKTAQRDIEFMRDRLHCPLLYDKSQKGYSYKDNTYTLPALYLSAEELSSLLIARKILSDIDDGALGEDVSHVIQRLTTILNDSVATPGLIDKMVSFKHVEYSPTPEASLKMIIEACIRNQTIFISYQSPQYDSCTERTVDPYHLLNYMGTWHLIAYCHKRKAMRDFVVGRIGEIKPTDNSFEIPEKFDLGKYLNSAFGIFKGKSTAEVTLRFSPNKSRWVKGQVWFKGQTTRLLDDGSLELSFPVASFDEVIMEILKHGSGVEVIKPEALRKRIKEEAKKILDVYKSHKEV